MQGHFAGTHDHGKQRAHAALVLAARSKRSLDPFTPYFVNVFAWSEAWTEFLEFAYEEERKICKNSARRRPGDRKQRARRSRADLDITWACSSTAEQGTHNPLVHRSNPCRPI